MYVDNIAYLNSLDSNVVKQPYIPGYVIAGLIIVTIVAIGQFIYIQQHLAALRSEKKWMANESISISEEIPS
jgi:hypothetical protein